jgi:hypothetical protein
MSVYSYVVSDERISEEACILHSVLLTNQGGNEGEVVIYDGSGAEAAYKVATVKVGAKESKQYHWKGLRLSRGLFVDIDDKTDMVTVEWEPIGYSEPESEWLKHLKESLP